MKTFREYLREEGEPWALPDYPEQVMAKDDPKGDWVTGDPPKPIETFPEVDGEVRGVESVARALDRANAVIKKEREAQKK